MRRQSTREGVDVFNEFFLGIVCSGLWHVVEFRGVVTHFAKYVREWYDLWRGEKPVLPPFILAQ